MRKFAGIYFTAGFCKVHEDIPDDKVLKTHVLNQMCVEDVAEFVQRPSFLFLAVKAHKD